MFLEPERTAYDLRFRVFGTPVRVNIWFWVFSAVLGWGAFRDLGIGYLALWVACVFFSVLLHELGHVWTGRVFGSDGHIILYSFGGLAVGSTQVPKRWQRVLVLLAGPGVQLVLFGVIYASWTTWLPEVAATWPRAALMAVRYLWVINLFWPLLNLVPVWPLDGGQISRELLEGVLGYKGVIASLWVSIVAAGVLALHAVLSENGRPLIPFLPPLGFYTAIFFAMMAMSSWQALQAETVRQRSWDDDRLPWER